MLGVSRTTLAMARDRHFPPALAAIHPRFRVPYRAELAIGAVVAVVAAVADLRAAIGFSSFGVLVYYFVANVSAFTQPSTDRRFPRWLQVLGAVSCLVLVATLPGTAVLVGVVVFVVGFAARWLRLRFG